MKNLFFISVLFFVGFTSLVQGESITIEADKPVTIVEGGKGKLAAELLHYIWPQITAAPLVQEGAKLSIHLGDTAASKPYRKTELANEGFIIAFPDTKNIVIWSPSERGVNNGTSEWLRRYAGVRWLFPGKEGLHTPMQKRITIPMKQVSDQPKFVSRFFSWPYPHSRRNDPEFLYWQRFNRLSRSIEFHHNLFELFPPQKYYATHRHFYPESMKSPNAPHTQWNPQLSAEGLTEEAIRSICETFRRDRKLTSYSLGMNDCIRFSDYTATGRNSMGYPDCSDYYYAWVNRVIEGVSKEFPDKYFGMLAYVSITDPPSFPLDKHAIPFICVDRMNWYDEQCAKRDQKRTLNWSAKAQRLGWYDYAYGNKFYYAPRIYNHLFADYIRFAAQNNVVAYYAEVYNSELPTEGPKTTLMAQLLWNPDTDVDKFLDEWYSMAVGAKAAPMLKSYFDFWEDFWKKKGIDSHWFKTSKGGTYLNFDDRSYLASLSFDDLDKCEEMLKQVVANSDKATAQQKKRAKLFLDSFKEAVRPRIEFALAVMHPPKLQREKKLLSDDFKVAGKEKNQPAPGWVFWQRFPGQSEAVHEPQGGENGSGAICIDLGKSQRALTLLQHTISPEKGAYYRLCCRMRVQDVPPGGDIFAQIDFKTDDTVYERFYNLRKSLKANQRDGAWQTLELVFTTPHSDWKRATISVGTQAVSKGKVIIDSLELFQERKK